MNIDIELSYASVTDALLAVQEYRESLNQKLTQLVAVLSENGIQTANYWISAAKGDADTSAYVDYSFDSSGGIVSAEISLGGKDALFVEFGAGIYYNAAGTPHASQFGMGVGTYPGQKNAFKDHWYYTNKETGETRIKSHGTQGTYPLYHAAVAMRNQLITRAIEIFME